MKSLKLNGKLLNLIHLIQAKKTLSLNESQMNLTSDWHNATKQYFEALDNKLIDDLGLAKNYYCLEAILAFNITDEMNRTNTEDLGKFSFSY